MLEPIIKDYQSFIHAKVIQFVYAIGFFGEQIAFIMVCYSLLSTPGVPIYFLIVYLIINVFNKVGNEYLKDFLQETRPFKPRKFLETDSFTHKKSYGLPSGHTQGVGFSTMFSWLVTKSHGVEYIILNAIVLYERYIFRNHTIFQLVMGLLIGVVLAYIVYFTTIKIISFIK